MRGVCDGLLQVEESLANGLKSLNGVWVLYRTNTGEQPMKQHKRTRPRVYKPHAVIEPDRGECKRQSNEIL